MKKGPVKKQVDGGIKKTQDELPDRSGRLTGHTRQPLKGTDPTTGRRPVREPQVKPKP